MKLKIIIHHGEDGYFTAQCPSLKSCWSQGKTREEAITNIKEAIELYLEPNLQNLREDSSHEIYELAI